MLDRLNLKKVQNLAVLGLGLSALEIMMLKMIDDKDNNSFAPLSF